MLDRLPNTKCKDEEVDWPPLGHAPLKERYGVLEPIPDYGAPKKPDSGHHHQHQHKKKKVAQE